MRHRRPGRERGGYRCRDAAAVGMALVPASNFPAATCPICSCDSHSAPAHPRQGRRVDRRASAGRCRRWALRVRSASVGFEVSTEAYGQFMGRFSGPRIHRDCWHRGGPDSTDVGCGAGALTFPLVEHRGVANVSAPDWNVGLGSAEAIPYADEQFDRTLAQLVVHFMTDPVRGCARWHE
jgi:hypothetical protein